MFTKLANAAYRSISNWFISTPCFEGRPSKAYQINFLMFKQNNVDSLRTTKKRVYTAHLLMTQCIYSASSHPVHRWNYWSWFFFATLISLSSLPMFTKLAHITYRSARNWFISTPYFEGRPLKAYQIHFVIFKQSNVDSLRTTKKRVYTVGVVK